MPVDETPWPGPQEEDWETSQTPILDFNAAMHRAVEAASEYQRAILITTRQMGKFMSSDFFRKEYEEDATLSGYPVVVAADLASPFCLEKEKHECNYTVPERPPMQNKGPYHTGKFKRGKKGY